MALKKPILSWLFGSRQKEDGAEPTAEAEMQAEQAGQAEEVQPLHDPAALELNPDHALYRLYELRQKEVGVEAPPLLRLDDPGVLPEGWIEKELGRLRQSLTTASGSRLTKSQPKPVPAKPKPTPEDPDAEPEPEEEPPLPELNALPWIFTSADKLAAWVLVFPPVGGGRELTRDALNNVMRENGIAYGMDEDLLNRLPDAKDRYFHLHLLASGQPAVDGKDGRIVDFFSRVAERKITVNDQGQVDYTALDLFQNADEGEAICQLIPHTNGEPGRNVLGKEIAARNGKKVTLPKGRNTVANDDGTKLLAAKAGHVEFTGRSFQVKPVLDISGNVDYSTGNINFLGDVHVRGDVCTGFTVRAVGNVQVEGVVGGAVEAGGDLIVAKGIVGGRETIIRAHRSVIAKYLENSSVHAHENLQTDCIMNSEVYSDGEIEVRSGRGAIIGGKVSAAKKISANIVGSKAEGLTRIVLGGLPCAEFERELLMHEIEDLEELIRKTECQPDSPTRLSRLSKSRMQVSVNRMKLAQMDKDLEEMREGMEEQEKARLECDVAYPGAEITIGSTTLRLAKETHKCVARLTGGEIRLF